MHNSIIAYEQELGPRYAGWRDRYWSHLDTSDPDACWIWKSKNKATRYPQLKVGPKASARMFYAHRIAYELAYGSIPPGLGVLHSCDIPWCCNPQHLRVGSQAENMQDAISRNRTARGEDHGNHRLTVEKVRTIRALYAEGMQQKEIASRFGVANATVWSVLSGRTWGHVA